MLSRILELWRGKSLISQMLDEFMEMLALGKSMFDMVTSAGMGGGDLEGVRDEVFAKDRTINQLEQSIRRKIVVHLSVQRDADVAACLVLMSVVKDAERVGDYAKNVFDVFKGTQGLGQGLYYDQLLKLTEEISASFTNVAEAFKSSDVQTARQLKEANYRLEKQCDAVISELLSGAECESPVAYVLLYRFFKRVLGHLSNIVSTVVMPVDKIDYFDAGSRGPNQPS